MQQTRRIRAGYSGRGRQRAFTLMELMITIVILSILAAIAIPTYTQQMQKSRRSEAQIALVEIANLEERFFSDNLRYSTTLNSATQINFATTTSVVGGGYYSLSVTTTGSPSTSYTVRAAPVAGKAQADDAGCTGFSLTSQGVKGATGSDSTNCWSK